MTGLKTYRFIALIDRIGINPFVSVPQEILASIFIQAGKDKGPIAIKGTINTKPFTQTLVKYAGAWRLYINTNMLKNSPQRIGESIDITVTFDAADRTIPMHPRLIQALNKNKKAKKIYNNLPPSLQKEIIRYISRLKSEDALTRNIEKAIGFLLGENKFIGRESV